MNLNRVFNDYISNLYYNAKNVTIKGGIVMITISKDKRRFTQNLDIDFIKYFIDDTTIIAFIEK